MQQWCRDVSSLVLPLFVFAFCFVVKKKEEEKKKRKEKSHIWTPLSLVKDLQIFPRNIFFKNQKPVRNALKEQLAK